MQLVPVGPSTCPPASFTTCTPVPRKRVVSDSTTYQLNSGKLSSKWVLPPMSVNSVLLNLPLRMRTRVGIWIRGGLSSGSRLPSASCTGLPRPCVSRYVLFHRCVCQVNEPYSMLRVWPPLTVTDRLDPSPGRSTNWSNRVNPQLPSGIPVNVRLPSGSHLTSWNVRPSVSPMVPQQVV